jgi:uncharacterized protein
MSGNVVVVCGGKWHDFDYVRTRLRTTLTAHVDMFEDYTCVSALRQAASLITYTCDQRPDPDQQRGLVEFVRDGGRWLALHGTNSAIDPPGRSGRYGTPQVFGPVSAVLGSRFVAHPPIGSYRVEISRPDHPLVAGLAPFEVRDELYVCELYPPLEVLLHTRFRGSCPGFEGHERDDDVHPVLYLRRHGRGEVCYLTLGHCRTDPARSTPDRGSWDNPQFQELLTRCAAWAVGPEGRTS